MARRPPSATTRSDEAIRQSRREHDRHRNRSEARSLYREPAWRTESAAFLLLHRRCTCSPSCSRPSEVVDHEPRHGGDPARFWDRRTWRPRAKRCHDAKTASRDGGFGNPLKA